MRIPLFPLHTVLFPDGMLRLRIFEPRYIDMVSDCLRSNSGFGVVPIKTGDEAGLPATPFDLGTLATIVDWDRGGDGLLGVVALGSKRFRVIGHAADANGLITGEIEWMAAVADVKIPENYRHLADLMEDLSHTAERAPGDGRRDSALRLAHGLSALLPITLEEKIELLRCDDACTKLARLDDHVETLRQRTE